MGKCFNCKKEITLTDGMSKCPNCDKEQKFRCKECSTEFYVKDTTDCSWCNWYFCPNCKICSSKDCSHFVHTEGIKNLNIFETVQYFGKISREKPRRCCYRGVPVTYGKGKIKAYYEKSEGIGTRNENDKNIFSERSSKIEVMEIGETYNINEIREDGSHGQEYRDASYSCICNGIIKCNVVEEDGSKRCVFERTKGEICQHYKPKQIFEMVCTKCNYRYSDLNKEYCDRCVYDKTTKKNKKGDSYKLKKRKIPNVEICEEKTYNFTIKNSEMFQI